MNNYLFTWALWILSLSPAEAQVPSSSTLYQEIMALDSILFEVSFNQCHTAVLAGLVAEDFEFYHDQSGITEGKADFINSIKQNICALDYRPERRLYKGSTEIYTFKNNGEVYGALQRGVHAFYAHEPGKEPYLTSTALFTHLWVREQGHWQLKRVLSYDHQGPEMIREQVSGN